MTSDVPTAAIAREPGPAMIGPCGDAFFPRSTGILRLILYP